MSEKARRKIIKASEKLFSSKCSSGHWECSFDNPVVMFSAEVKIFFCSNFNRMSKLYPSQQNFLHQSVCWTRDLRFWQPGRKIFAKFRSFFHSECQSDRKKTIVYKKKPNSLENFSRDERNEVWQPCLKFSIISKTYLLEFLGERHENYKIFEKNFVHKVSHGTRRKQFWWPCPYFFAKITKVQSLVSQVPKSSEKCNTFLIDTKYARMVKMDTQKKFWKTFSNSSGNSELLQSKLKM